jgi:hypothetical protein
MTGAKREAFVNVKDTSTCGYVEGRRGHKARWWERSTPSTCRDKSQDLRCYRLIVEVRLVMVVVVPSSFRVR